MPLHDVKCSKCGRIEEFFWPMDSKPNEIECACGSKRTEILMGCPIINMNNRPVEKELERQAGDGVF